LAAGGEGTVITAQFRIQLPEHMWVSELSRRFPTAEFRLLSGHRLDEHALELGEVLAESLDRAVDAMRSHHAIRSYELLESEPSRALAKYETTQTDLYDFAELSSLTIEFPVEVRNGWYRFDLTGTREELDDLQAVLDRSPLSYELESLVSRTETDSLLTDRQREVLSTAVRMGYYSVPRECTLAEVADALAVDKSSVSTTLRRGEAKLVKSALLGPGPE